MDDVKDFKLPVIRVGDLVRYAEYRYHPQIYNKSEIEDGALGIVVRVDTTYMGYEVHYIMWLKTSQTTPTARGNLKLVHSKK
jgi:hypothetical protein